MHRVMLFFDGGISMVVRCVCVVLVFYAVSPVDPGKTVL